MKGKRYPQEFKELVLRDVKETQNVVVVAKKHDLPVSTVHTWLKKSNGRICYEKKSSSVSETIVEENKKLKKLMAEQTTKINILNDLLKKTYQIWEPS